MLASVLQLPAQNSEDRWGYRSPMESRSSLLCLDTKLSSFLPKRLTEEPKPCRLQAKTQIIHPTWVQRPRLCRINPACPDLPAGPCMGMPGAFRQLPVPPLPPAGCTQGLAVLQRRATVPGVPARADSACHHAFVAARGTARDGPRNPSACTGEAAHHG